MTTVETNEPQVRDYTIPEGCPVCSADLPVRVTPVGASAICTHCTWMGRPVLTVTHRGLQMEFPQAEA